MLIKEVFVVMCCYLYIQSLSKIAVSILSFLAGKYDDWRLRKLERIEHVLYVIILIK